LESCTTIKMGDIQLIIQEIGDVIKKQDESTRQIVHEMRDIIKKQDDAIKVLLCINKTLGLHLYDIKKDLSKIARAIIPNEKMKFE